MKTLLKKSLKAYFLLAFLSFGAQSGEWCDFEHYTVVTHGNISDNVYLNGKLAKQNNGIWVVISNGTIGSANVSLAMAAQVAGKGLSIYLDEENATCATFPNWAPFGKVRHFKML